MHQAERPVHEGGGGHYENLSSNLTRLLALVKHWLMVLK